MVVTQVEKGDFEGLTSLGIKVNNIKMMFYFLQDYEVVDFKFLFKLLINSGFMGRRINPKLMA